MAARLGGLGQREDLLGANGGRLLWLYRVPAKNLPTDQVPLAALQRGGAFIKPQVVEHAIWENQIWLLGYTVEPAGPGGRNLTVTLFLRALRAMTGDYDFSIKARDSKGRVWGQEDKYPGDNSYPTNSWSIGDVVVEKFYPGLNPCAPAGDYTLTVEAYERSTGRVLSLSDRGGQNVTLGRVHAGASQGNRLQDLEPGRIVDVDAAPEFHLLGFESDTDQVRAGDPFSVMLYWRGYGKGGMSHPVAVHLYDSSGENVMLALKDVTLPSEGRGLCTLFDLTVPDTVAPGTAAFLVNDIQIETINISR